MVSSNPPIILGIAMSTFEIHPFMSTGVMIVFEKLINCLIETPFLVAQKVQNIMMIFLVLMNIEVRAALMQPPHDAFNEIAEYCSGVGHFGLDLDKRIFAGAAFVG
jgi:hypothetical protein